ncbi:DNA-3-methyladenine glycosylase I [Ponticaulis sp.]|uniref:DNA-3-methyladenine glycosylase I n=1 Tax=Ponticaulis sp. TaxID=2020902 RepID=UPI000B72EAE3|nr:DNA-3-methyladenine glycosylase I [Ponticaulis sp.]MAI92047.1 DNA-3-methyladenine glycosylase I [Ponticaulis sp.]OUX96226.1 MAG: DNA-3-methyladenine glycosylase [Hyphomonadaceae bacterium TMED5]|tara:strand:- start:14218 stop:14808 length:591 start_codon:yes stop_codon:yes gene_type:complete
MSAPSDIHCPWAPADDPVYRAYHDTEWGVPEYDGRALWEKLQLDGFQAGLSWRTILYKRESMREEFDQFDPISIADWDDARIETALQNPGIIRSTQKIRALIGNAKAYLAFNEAGEDFSEWMWSFVDGKPVQNSWTNFRDAPVKDDASEAMSKALKKRGFKYCGPVIVYAFMQAVGMINDHETACPRHSEVQKFAR